MAVNTLKVLGAALVTNATAVATAAGGGSIAAANISALGRMLQVMDDNKGLAIPPLLKLSTTDQSNLSTTVS